MATDLPTLGNLAYNGVEFSTPCHTTSMAGNPVYDDAGRMVKYVEWTLSVAAYVSDPEAGADTSEVMENIRRKLTEPGQVLVYEGKGFGDLTINSGTVRDVKWGPKPELLTWQPIGADQTAYVEWRVSFRIPECATAKYKNRIMAWCYEASFSIDQHGYLTFTYSGSVEIPLTFGAGGTLPDTADNYWDSVFPPLPTGFQRTQNQRTLSMDRSALSFTIVDQELPMPLPAGCTFAEAEHRFKMRRAGSSISPVGVEHTFSATYRVNPKLGRAVSWLRFKSLVRSRRAELLAGQVPNTIGGIAGSVAAGASVAVGGSGAGSGTNSLSIMVTDFSCRESIYGADQSFSISLFLVRPRSITTLLRESGLWTPTGDTHAVWRDSVQSGPYSAKGNGGAYYNQQADTIIDLCKNLGTARQQYNHAIQVPPTQALTPQEADASSVMGETTGASSSWLSYQTRCVYSEENHVVRHTPLTGSVSEVQPTANLGAGTNLATRSTQGTINQRTAPPAAKVRLFGIAWRLGMGGIQPPRLVKFQGVNATQSRIIRHEPLADRTFCGTIMHGLIWDIEYNLDKPPDSLPLASTLIGPGGPSVGNVNLGTIGIVNPSSQGPH